MAVRRFSIFDQPVDFIDCDDVAAGFQSILRGWTITETPFDPSVAPYLSFEKRSYGYHWDAPWIPDRTRRVDNPSVSVMDAVCDFHYEFIDWFVDRHPDFFCLHTAAVAFAGKAVLFPSAQKAGKSTLTIELASRGHQVLGDDVVALTPDGRQAYALGLLPRIRLPLPPEAIAGSLRGFVDAHAGLSDRHWMYVDLPAANLLPLGASVPVGGIVLLERGHDEASLTPVTRSQAIKALIDQNFGRLRDPDAIFDCLQALAESSDCMLLRYARPADAARLIENHFDG